MMQLVSVLLGRLHKFCKGSLYLTFSSSKSASCTHVSSLLHALASLSPCTIGDGDISSDEKLFFLLCQWNMPRKHKESNHTVSEAMFCKHVWEAT